jgi:hypothetical protein
MTQSRSYYGRPVLKEPVWTPEIPIYLFTGGLAGASAGLAWLAELRGNEPLARRAWITSLVAVTVSPGLLISDLGRPERFLNMLRMFKVTSPMSVGSWILAGCGATTALATAGSIARRPVPFAKPAAAALGLPLATYTGALLAQTAIPVWSEARGELPLLFASGAAASAGAIATLVTPPPAAGAARRLAIVGAAGELVSRRGMDHRLGELAAPYRHGPAGLLARLARALTTSGAVLVAAGGRRRHGVTLAGAGLLAGGSIAERFSVFRAGFQSARDPAYTVGPQRARAS